MNGISTRLAAACGAYFVGAVIIGALGPTRSKPGLLLILTGFAALLVFLGYLQRLLSAGSGSGGIGSTVMRGCGLIFLAMQASELAYFAVQYLGGASGTTADFLRDLIEATYVASTIFFGLFVLSAALTARVRRVLPGWLTWPGVAVGALAAAAGAVGTLAPESDNHLPYVAALAWTAVVSVLLAVRPSGPGNAATPAPAPKRANVAGAV